MHILQDKENSFSGSPQAISTQQPAGLLLMQCMSKRCGSTRTSDLHTGGPYSTGAMHIQKNEG